MPASIMTASNRLMTLFFIIRLPFFRIQIPGYNPAPRHTNSHLLVYYISFSSFCQRGIHNILPPKGYFLVTKTQLSASKIHSPNSRHRNFAFLSQNYILSGHPSQHPDHIQDIYYIIIIIITCRGAAGFRSTQNTEHQPDHIPGIHHTVAVHIRI